LWDFQSKEIVVESFDMRVEKNNVHFIVNKDDYPQKLNEIVGDGYCASMERERGFLILILKNSDNHGEGDLLPWIMNIWILENSWISD
jgi:hypothetical protein